MSWLDIINGTYELLGGLFILNNCYKLYQDKEIKGVSFISNTFFTTWSIWNLYYYPSLNQWVSFFGGLSIALSNILWISLAFYYIKNKDKIKNNI